MAGLLCGEFTGSGDGLLELGGEVHVDVEVGGLLAIAKAIHVVGGNGDGLGRGGRAAAAGGVAPRIS